jgi:Cu+-exporting ATPase
MQRITGSLDEGRITFAPKPSAETRTRDPVCGMMIEPRDETSTTLRGQAIYFCSDTCKARFAAEPARFVGAAEQK